MLQALLQNWSRDALALQKLDNPFINFKMRSQIQLYSGSRLVLPKPLTLPNILNRGSLGRVGDQHLGDQPLNLLGHRAAVLIVPKKNLGVQHRNIWVLKREAAGDHMIQIDAYRPNLGL